MFPSDAKFLGVTRILSAPIEEAISIEFNIFSASRSRNYLVICLAVHTQTETLRTDVTREAGAHGSLHATLLPDENLGA